MVRPKLVVGFVIDQVFKSHVESRTRGLHETEHHQVPHLPSEQHVGKLGSMIVPPTNPEGKQVEARIMYAFPNLIPVEGPVETLEVPSGTAADIAGHHGCGDFPAAGRSSADVRVRKDNNVVRLPAETGRVKKIPDERHAGFLVPETADQGVWNGEFTPPLILPRLGGEFHSSLRVRFGRLVSRVGMVNHNQPSTVLRTLVRLRWKSAYLTSITQFPSGTDDNHPFWVKAIYGFSQAWARCIVALSM